MKFFHVYNDEYFEGLVKNNLINQDTGFKDTKGDVPFCPFLQVVERMNEYEKK